MYRVYQKQSQEDSKQEPLLVLWSWTVIRPSSWCDWLGGAACVDTTLLCTPLQSLSACAQEISLSRNCKLHEKSVAQMLMNNGEITGPKPS